MTLFLGIDVGTSGIRSAVVDATGELVSVARAAHVPQPGEDVDANLWWDALRTCLQTQVQELVKAGLTPRDIAALAVDGTSGSMVLTDAGLEPVSPALMYNSQGFEDEAAEIARWAPDPHITRGSNSALARAMRLVRTAQGPATHLLHQADFIAAKLMGQGGLSDHNNALKTGYDPHPGAWPSWIDKVIAVSLLPNVRPIGTPFGLIDASVAKGLGLDETTKVVAGTTDSVGAYLAAAPLEPGTAVTSLGSTLAVKLLTKQRIDAPEIGLYAHKVGQSWLVGGASNTGGAVLSHFFAPDALEDLSRLIDPDRPTGLNYYPLLRPGERFPINDPNYAGCMDPRPEDDHVFLAALFEGIAEVERRCYDEIARYGGGYPKRVFSAGGGAHNPVFSAIRSKAIQTDICLAEHSEAAVGSAKLAMQATRC